MSYIVFARKWRPRNFDQLIGQDIAVRTLKNAIKDNRLAHAYIFAGPRGVGKTSAARILAKSLNCLTGPALNPCDKCPSCREIAEARSLDVIEIDGASNRGIDDIRALRENVKFSPASGKFKVYIIDEVHQITPEGFNALLKTLEEPPPHVKFIFATTHPQKIPSTIISRCHLLEFRRISNIDIIKQLKEIIAAEKIKVGEDALLAVAKAADGSMRDAESILDELISFSKGDVVLADVYSVLGVIEQDYLFEITAKIIKKDAPGALILLDQLIDQGKDVNQLLINLIEHYRNLMISKTVSSNYEKLLDLPLEVCQAIVKQAQGLSLEDIFSGFNSLVNVQETSRYLDNLRIPLEFTLAKLSSSGLPKAETSSRPSVASQPAAPYREARLSAPLPAAKPPAVNPARIPAQPQPPAKDNLESQVRDKISSGINLDSEKIKQLWSAFIERLNKVKVSAAHYLEGGVPVKTLGSVLTIGFPQRLSFNKESLERKENVAVLESVWRDMLNQDIKINFALVKEELRPEPGSSPAMDPAVQSALDTFNGRVVRKD